MSEEQTNSLPTVYAAAERLATDMLSAATQGDWQTVVKLREEIPSMARDLELQWSAVLASDPRQALRLEKKRLGAIMRVLAVDDQIRRLCDPWSERLDRWLGGGRASRTIN